MTAFAGHLIDAVRTFAAIAAICAALPACIGGVGWMVEADDEKAGPRMKALFLVAGSVLAIGGAVALFLPGAETRKAIALEMEGGAK